LHSVAIEDRDGLPRITSKFQEWKKFALLKLVQKARFKIFTWYKIQLNNV